MAFNGILYRQAGGTLELNRSVGSFCVVESAKLEDKWQDGGVATLVLQTTEVLTFYSGDYIIARGKRYLICKTISEYTTLDDGKHQYTIPLESPDALFKNALMYNTVEIEDGGVYSWSRPNNFIMELGSVETLVKACCYNVNEVMGRRVFKLGTIDASVSDEYRVINFSDNNCWAGLKQTCEHFDTFYTIRANTDETPDSDYIVDIGVEPGTFPETLQVGMRQGIAELTMNYADEDVYTQFVVLGSTENLPRAYPHERLQLDEDLAGTPPVYEGSLMVDDSKYTRWGRKRMELVFDDIKPTRPATITGLPPNNIFAFYDTSLSDIIALQPNWNPVGGTVHILDRSLMGYTFEIIAFHSGTQKITIKQISDSNGLVLPNEDEETFRFAKGMKYNLAGIALPNSYVVDAKTRLKAAAVNAINGYWTQPRASFSLTPDPFFLREKETDISCGWLIPIKHDALEIDKSIRVTSVTYDLLKDTYFDIDSVEVADITGKDNFMNSVHKSTQRSLNMLRDQGIINSPTAKENNLTAILNRIALSLHLPNWDTLLEMLGEEKGLFTLINEDGEDVHVVNTDLLRAGTALVNSLFTNELFVSGVQSETESLVNNYILHLTSQVATVACDSEGTVTGELPGSTAIVYHGASADTGWSFSGEFSGCTGSVNSSTGIITITGLTADNSTVTVSATKTDKPTLQAIFRISKVYAGIDGEDGADSVIYYLTPSVDNVVKSMSGTLTPSSVTCAQYKVVGNSLPTAGDKTLKYKRSIDASETAYTVAVEVSTSIYIDFILYDGETQLYKTRVPVLIDSSEWETYLDNAAKGIGYVDYDALVAAAAAGTTLLNGGYIRTSLIEAGTIVANHIAALTITANNIANSTITGGKIASATIEAANIKDSTITGGKIALATITAANIFGGTITATEIADATITGGKIALTTIEAANIANSTITGGKIAGTTITAANIANSTITGAKIASGTITAANIYGGTITATEIANSTITGGKIASATITAANIFGGTITATEIADATITGGKIALTTIEAANIANSTITGGKIAGTTITAANIANSTITGAKIASGTITAANIYGGTITATEIANSTITGGKIASATIEAANIKDSTITGGKIANTTITNANIVDSTIKASKIDVSDLIAASAFIDNLTVKKLQATDGTTSVDISPTAVSGSAGVRVSKGDAFARIGLSGSWPSVWIRQGGGGTPGTLLTPGQVTVGDTVYAILQKNQLSLSGLVFNTTNLGTGNVVKTSGGGFLRFGTTVDNEDGSHKHNKISGYTVVIGTGSDPDTIYFSTA